MLPNQLSPLKPDGLVQQWLAESTLQRGAPDWQVLSTQAKHLPNNLEGLSALGVSRQNSAGHLPLEDEAAVKRTASNTHYPDLGEKYSRRQRNKTRYDRYELKEKKPRQPKGPSKRKARHKSEAESQEVFHAPNVHTERLTLNPTLGPGIFAKGKASEPVEWQGLPDLTFSEMTFLRRKREQGGRHFRGNPDSSALKRTKDMPSEGISRFFSRPGQNSASPKSKTMQPYHLSTNLSPTRTPRDDVGHSETTGRHGLDGGSLRQKSCSRSMSSKKASSTSAISWSKLPPDHSDRLRKEHRRPCHALLEASTIPRLQEDGSHCKASRTATMYSMSSPSSRLLKEYTDSALLSDVKKWSRLNKEYLSLEDLKQLAMKTAKDEAVSFGDNIHHFDDSISTPERCPNTTTHPLPNHEFNKDLAHQASRFSEGSISSPVTVQGRSRVEEQAPRASLHHLSEHLEPQPVQFRLSIQDDLDCHLDGHLLEYPTRQTIPLNVNTSARQFPVLESISQSLQSPVCKEFSRSAHLNISRDYGTPPYDPEQDSDSLDPFDFQLLGIDHSGCRVSLSMMDATELTRQGPHIVGNLTYLPSLPRNSTTFDTANMDGTLIDPNIYNYGFNNRLTMQPPSPKQVAHSLGDRLGLISRRPEDPIEEGFTGLSRPHILY
ncbi:uncharacterized protein A1O9_04899 [Exophiala aquamarina CBS 119918]|uniref:Uncharacterized protein n=1 Tax=Exophiala aquamarina CBS 119918 TaxID=1182545 RepID=A0A072PIU0_9EURO|nr:uncharacterized protein A1O9_04899 [Exophiala aquamarina CBS 119918]KEF60049.1 hypothetical protein A1O9_04899 [Exophiala aquamarina CBS 119918]